MISIPIGKLYGINYNGALKIKIQFIIPDFFYLNAIFNLQCDFLYPGTICISKGTFFIPVGTFSIPVGAMCIPAGTISIPGGSDAKLTFFFNPIVEKKIVMYRHHDILDLLIIKYL